MLLSMWCSCAAPAHRGCAPASGRDLRGRELPHALGQGGGGPSAVQHARGGVPPGRRRPRPQAGHDAGAPPHASRHGCSSRVTGYQLQYALLVAFTHVRIDHRDGRKIMSRCSLWSMQCLQHVHKQLHHALMRQTGYLMVQDSRSDQSQVPRVAAESQG